MGSIFRKPRRRRDGTTYREKHYTISYLDGITGKPKSAPGFSDKKCTQEKMRQLELREQKRAVGLPVATLDSERHAWAATVAAYLADLARQGRSQRYRDQLQQELADAANWCNWERIEDVRADRLTEYLAHLAGQGKGRAGRPGAAPRTVNAYRDAVAGFLAWCVAQGQLASNPAARVAKAGLGAPGDLSRRPRSRRSLTVSEFTALLAAEQVKPWRRELYEVAGLSGLRANELHQLCPVDFTLGPSPRWHLRPEITKGKRLDQVPMLPECARLLARLAAEKDSLDQLFPRRPHHRTVARDLVRAGIKLRDPRGRWANFHSLRYHFCCLVGAVLPIQRVRVLMRHRDIRTTCNLYLDLGIEDLADQLASLPPLYESARRATAGAATGFRDTGA